MLVPPHNEQKRIADKLDTLLTRVEACQERLDRVQLILERFRQSVLANAASGALTQAWREKMGLSLDSWQLKSGEETFSFITSGSRGWAKYYANSGARFLRVGNLQHDTIRVNLDNVQHVDLPPEAEAEGMRTRVEMGDILISITADVGRVALIEEDLGETYINQHLCLARQNGELSSKYLAYYLASSSGGRGQLVEVQRGVAKAGVTLANIKELVIRIPERIEQAEIVRRAESLFALADRIESHYQTARTHVEHLIPVLLDKAFRGELVPQDPEDEPASALLKQIREARAVARAQPPEPRRRVEMENKKTVRPKDSQPIGVVQALRQVNQGLSAADLFKEAGYPGDAESELIEAFFVEVRDALVNGEITRTRRHNMDWFALKNEKTIDED